MVVVEGGTMMLRGWCSSSAGGGTVERDREREGRGLPLEIQGRGVATRVDGATLKVQGSSTC